MEKIAIGIDIGGTNSAIGVVDRQGNVYAQAVLSTKDYPDFDIYIDKLQSKIKELLQSLDFQYELVGIGVGAPNANYYKGTIENAPNLAWKGVVPFTEKLQLFYPAIPIILTNDAKAAAVGEMIYGGAKGMRNFIVITLGTGLGSGFVANGEVIYGHDSFAGELGHTTINYTGRECGCGRRGCLETYVSATGIKRTAFKLLADHTGPSEFRALSFNDLTAEMITNAALNGDPLAIEAYQYTGMILGRALANAVTVTSPEAIFLFGGLAKAGKYLFEPTQKHFEASLLSNYKGKIKLLPSGIDGKNAAVLGASSLVWGGGFGHTEIDLR